MNSNPKPHSKKCYDVFSRHVIQPDTLSSILFTKQEIRYTLTAPSY